jgi:hypothetical protein
MKSPDSWCLVLPVKSIMVVFVFQKPIYSVHSPNLFRVNDKKCHISSTYRIGIVDASKMQMNRIDGFIKPANKASL